MDKYYSDISKFLESRENSKSITTDGLEDLVYKIRSFTGLNTESSQIVLKTILSEIRNAMLRGEYVNLIEFGSFYISSPKVTGSNKRIFPFFKPARTLINLINDKNL